MKFKLMIGLYCLLNFCSFSQGQSIQQRLNKGETPYGIYRRNPTFLDSLYSKKYAGGIIFYLDTQSGSGMVAAPSDLYPNGATWGCNSQGISDNSIDFGTGKQNTIGIVNQCSEPNTVANACKNLTLNQYNDWYLPSRDELKMMMSRIGKDKSFGNNPYWSSSQWGQWGGMENYAYTITPGLTIEKYTKVSIRWIRPVRNFFEPTLPQLSTPQFVVSSSSSAVAYSNILDNGGGIIIRKGICYSTSTNPDTSIRALYDTSSGMGIVLRISGLTTNTKYYVKSFAVNGKGIDYSEQSSFTTSVSVGETYLGGIVVYILQSGDTGYSATTTHGIIADSTDHSVMWYPDTTTTWCNRQPTPNDTAIGWGKINTEAILLNCPILDTFQSSVAHLSYGWYNQGWYIPSKAELNAMRRLKNVLNMNYREGGNFNGSMYWSSSIADWSNKRAWAQSFYNNIPQADNPGYQEPYYMRHWWPVRRVKYF